MFIVWFVNVLYILSVPEEGTIPFVKVYSVPLTVSLQFEIASFEKLFIVAVYLTVESVELSLSAIRETVGFVRVGTVNVTEADDFAEDSSVPV